MHARSLRALGLLAVLVMSFLVGPSVGRFSTAVVAELDRNGALHDVADAFGNIAYAASQLQGPERPGPKIAAQDTLAPFAGSWGRHGYSLTIQPNGAGDARWRLYQLCDDPGVQPPCDPDQSGGGHAVLQLTSVDGDTAYGGLADVTDPTHPVFLSASLTLQPDGTALLVTGDDATVRSSPRRQTDGTTLCRPDAWQTGVCGA